MPPPPPALGPSAHVDTFTRDRLPPADTWPELRFTLPGLHHDGRLNCAVELLRAATVDGGRRCLVGETGTWTYAELDARSDQVARVLTGDLRLVPGNRVLLRGPNNPWLVAAWFGVLKAGLVAVTTMPLLRAGELRTMCAIARPDAAICDARYAGELLAAGPDVPPVLTYGDDGDPADLVARCARKPTGFLPVATGATDVALLAFTSGTTGRPKCTMHFHRDVLAIADTFAAHLVRLRPGDLVTGSPPLGFTFGLGGLVVFPLRAGAATLLLERAGPDALLEAVPRHGASALFTAPTAYRALARATGDDGGPLASLRRCVSAGDTLPRATWEAFRDATGIRVIDGIGSTELLHVFVSAADDAIRPGATGLPVPGYDARVVGDDGEPVPDGQTGLLAVRGPTGCRYLGGDRQDAYVRHGWNVTGDLYVRDGDGYLWFRSRADDLIVTAGYNVAGPEVEAALLEHPSVAEAAVVGVPDPDRGHVVKAFVVVAADGTPRDAATAAALRDFVKTRIAPYKAPRAVEFVDDLPRTATGKLQRFRLPRTPAGHPAAVPTPAPEGEPR